MLTTIEGSFTIISNAQAFNCGGKIFHTKVSKLKKLLTPICEVVALGISQSLSIQILYLVLGISSDIFRHQSAFFFIYSVLVCPLERGKNSLVANTFSLIYDK